jgi:hypothetical protein
VEHSENDEARMTNDEGITNLHDGGRDEDAFWLGDDGAAVPDEPDDKPVDENDEARMTNDEGITNLHDGGRDEDAFWLGDDSTTVREEPADKPIYDLEERTAQFGEAIIDFAREIPRFR